MFFFKLYIIRLRYYGGLVSKLFLYCIHLICCSEQLNRYTFAKTDDLFLPCGFHPHRIYNLICAQRAIPFHFLKLLNMVHTRTMPRSTIPTCHTYIVIFGFLSFLSKTQTRRQDLIFEIFIGRNNICKI